jgi:YgiT-type zinc finger domain-containing protein
MSPRIDSARIAASPFLAATIRVQMDVTIEELNSAVRNGRVRITDHADEEARADRLTVDKIFDSVARGEVLEQYPVDRPYPSCLVLGRAGEVEPVHSVWAYNSKTGWAVLVTVYRPDPRALDRFANEKESMSWPFEKCPVCGGELSERVVEKLLRGGADTAIIRVTAQVCLRCGERLYPVETVKRFEAIRAQLERKETTGLEPIGTSFQVAS